MAAVDLGSNCPRRKEICISLFNSGIGLCVCVCYKIMRWDIYVFLSS